jgi:cardiolipin hydrolase
VRSSPSLEIFQATLADGRLTRSERSALRQLLADQAPDAEGLAQLRKAAFEAARGALEVHPAAHVLGWLEDVLKATLPAEDAALAPRVAEAHFSPGEACREAILRQLEATERTLELCVFTITDDRLAEAIIATHERGVRVRLVTDDQKAEDRGSDVDRMARAGIPVRADLSEAHMHHKFAIFDRARLLNGSYNWTRSAFLENQENILVTDEPRLVRAFAATFEQLWEGPDTGPHRPL